MKYISILALPVLFSSCNMIDNLGTGGIIALFVVLILSLFLMFFYIAKKKNQAQTTANAFSNDVKRMLDRITTPEAKVIALEQLVERINNDEKYKKNTSWRDTVLSKVYQHMSVVYFNIGDMDKVIEVCTLVISVEPSHMMSYYNRGSLYSNKGEYDKAIKDLTDAISLDMKYSNSYNNRGLVYSKTGDFEEAILDFSYALDIEPTAIIYYNRANAYLEINEYEKAKTDYQAALEMDPNDNAQIRETVDVALDMIDKKLAGGK